MSYEVTLTEQAENDLRGIFEYIAFDLLSPENAIGPMTPNGLEVVNEYYRLYNILVERFFDCSRA